jgi:hypothetical protein
MSIYKNLNFYENTLAISHALNHSCHQLSLLLVQVMIFCKIDHVFLIEVNPTDTLESFAAYWQHLNIAWPQQVPKQAQNFTRHNKVKIEIIVEKFTSFICDIFNNMNINPMFCKQIIHLQSHGISYVFAISKNIKVM